MKTKILNIFALFMCVTVISSCNDWLDMDPTNKVSEKIVWSKPKYVDQYLFGFYPYLNLYGSFGGNESELGMTEGCTETLKYGSIVPGKNVGFANIVAFAEGGLNSSTASFHYGMWDKTYTRVRRVNEFLYNLNKFGTGHDAGLIKKWSGSARFFRGLLYYELIRRHKNIVLYDEDLLAISESKALSSEEDGWNFVYEDLMFAASALPEKVSASETGLLTQGAAYALLSRAMLYAERWDDARIAAEAVMSDKFDYALMPGTTAAEYAKAFTSAQANNTEAIMEFNYLVAGPNHNWNELYMPGGDYNKLGGSATPTQEMVESYEIATIGGHPDWTPWHTKTGTKETPPYATLEPRFHASILYNGCSWKGRALEPYIGGKDGWASFNDGSNLAARTTTGYYLRKMLNEKHTDYSLKSAQTWVGIRLAEVILNHAEACAMLDKTADANSSVRAIRSRVGLPYDNLTGAELMDAIRQERKIELYCEGHRWWDMRRWKLASKAYTGPNSRVHGFKIEKEGASFLYTYVDCDKQDRNFPEKLYRIPLPEEEITNNTAVKQFPEWL